MQVGYLLTDGGEDCVVRSQDGSGFQLSVGEDPGAAFPVAADAMYSSSMLPSEVYGRSCAPLVDHVARGFNGLFIQLGASKSDLLFGPEGAVKGAMGALHSELSTQVPAFACSCVEIDNESVRDVGKHCMSNVEDGVTPEWKALCVKIPGAPDNRFFAPMQADALSPEQLAEEDCQVLVDDSGVAYFSDVSIFPVTKPETLDALLAQVASYRASSTGESGVVRTSIVFTIYITTACGNGCRALRFMDLAPNSRLTPAEREGQRLKDAMSISHTYDALQKVMLFPTDASAYQASKLTAMLAGSLDLVSMLSFVSISGDAVDATKDTIDFTTGCRASASAWDLKVIDRFSSKVANLNATNSELEASVVALQTQLAAASQSRASTPHGSKKSGLNGRKVVALMDAFGITSTLGTDNTITANGKSVDVRVLAGIAEGGAGAAQDGTEQASSSSGGAGVGASDKAGSSKNEPSSKKLKKIIGDLEDELRESKSKAKERKDEITDKAKLIQTLTQSLTRAQTSLRHKEFQYDTLELEKVRAVDEIDAKLRGSHGDHLKAVVAGNTAILQQQHKLLQSVPENLRTFTMTRQGLQQKFKESDNRAREERDLAMKKLSQGQKEEIKNLKLQYEHWLQVKNDQIRHFAKQFNEYREEKAKHIDACEKEIVRLFDHANKLQNILGGVEQGEYSVTQGQSSIGRPTTGVILAVDDNYDIRSRAGPRTASTREEMASATRRTMGGGSSRSGARAQTAPNNNNDYGEMGMSRSMDGNFPTTVNVGGIVLPKGLRPTNPFLTKNQDTSLAKQIVTKYKALQEAAAAVQENNFQETLEQAAAGKTLGVLDPEISGQIKAMLTTSTMSREGLTYVNLGSKGPKRSEKKMDDVDMDEDDDDMGVNLEDYMPKTNNYSDPSSGGGLAGVMPPSSGAFSRGGGNNKNDEEIVELNREVYRLKSDITRLEAAAMAEKIRAQKVVRNLQSDEVLVYIQKLEEQKGKLHTTLRDVSSQLHTSRVTNTSLSRRLDKVSKSMRLAGVLEETSFLG